MSNAIIRSDAASIGQLAAEADDDFLFDCFVNTDAYAALHSRESSSMIALGGTGSGKTAIARMISRNEGSSVSLELDELSLHYVSNSDVLRFLHEVGVSLDHFFQALWKHIICLEYIKLKYRVTDEASSRGMLERLRQNFLRDDRRKKALQYLEKWEFKFWISYDESAREIIQSLEKNVTAAAGAEIDRFKLDAGYSRKLSEDKRVNLQQRLKKFVDTDLLADLAQVISLLSEAGEDRLQTHYVIVDKLDENWVDTGVRYRLIRALVEALKSMRRITSLKAVVALRSDLFEKVILETSHAGFQAEKYTDYIHNVRWSSSDLKELINKRIGLLYRRKYTKENVTFEDIFPRKVGKTGTLNYILDRTYMRPRDVIIFANLCFDEAEGKGSISERAIRSAEIRYSDNRLSAIVDEWQALYPAIRPMIEVLRGRGESFPMSELLTTRLQESLLISLYEDDKFKTDALYEMLDKAVSNGGDQYLERIVEILIERLHLIGVIGINTRPDSPYDWFFKSNRRIRAGTVTPKSKIRIHPMLHSALGLR